MKFMQRIKMLRMWPLLYVTFFIAAVYGTSCLLGFYRFTGVLSGTGNVDTPSLVFGLMHVLFHLLFTLIAPLLLLMTTLTNGIEIITDHVMSKNTGKKSRSTNE